LLLTESEGFGTRNDFEHCQRLVAGGEFGARRFVRKTVWRPNANPISLTRCDGDFESELAGESGIADELIPLAKLASLPPLSRRSRRTKG